MQAGNTATTTTARQSLTEGDSPSIFSHSSTMQAGNTATTMTVCQSLTERGGVIVFCLEFLLRSNLYLKEYPPSVGIANGIFPTV